MIIDLGFDPCVRKFFTHVYVSFADISEYLRYHMKGDDGYVISGCGG